jgi:transposase
MKIEELLRLRFAAGLSNRQIARSCALSRTTVGNYLRRAEQAGIGWPLPEGLTQQALEQTLFPKGRRPCPSGEHPQPDWVEIHQELRRKGVTLMLLWQEYQERYPDTGYQYSRFAQLYRQWRDSVDVVMRQTHAPGEKLFVDFAGQTVGITDRHSGEVRQAEIFVASLGASNYTYAEATWTQGAEDWIEAHIHAFEFLQGCAAVLVPDNLKTAVTLSHRYDPDLNRSYAEMARFYGAAIVPARIVRPRDKAIVENAVQRVEQWILARLRHHPFFSLGELNRHIRRLLEELNNKPFQKLPGSRRSQFEQLDQPALKPLPAQRYEFGEWCTVRVAPNIHVRVDGCYYSVPHTLVRKQVEVRLSAATVEIFYQDQRHAVHVRSYRPGHYTTVRAHMPEGHQRHLEWTPERLLSWAANNGPQTQALIQAVLDSRVFPQQAFNACLGIMRLGQSYGMERLEAACQRALHFGTHRYRSIESILKNGLDREPLSAPTTSNPIAEHANLRGSDYYH